MVGRAEVTSSSRVWAAGPSVADAAWIAPRLSGRLPSMAGWRIRDFHDDDIDQLVRIWDESRVTDLQPVYGLAEVVAAARGGGLAVAAVHGEVVVGSAIARIAGDRAWVLLLALASDFRGRGLGSAMLTELEKRATGAGVRRLCSLLPQGETGAKAFVDSGYEARDLAYFERVIPIQAQNVVRLGELGGRILPPGLWDELAGMVREKEIIERRLVLPLADPLLADEFGVFPPRAVVLFGPPGTGKTTFVKAVASWLGWPFLEVFPSRLAAQGPGGVALALRETFDAIGQLEHVVVFIDEVEEIAGIRGAKPPSPLQGVTNELLKIIPSFREREGRLLVVATNFIRALDPAFLRHGRFDYVIPVGPPDATAREAIWRRYLPEAVRDEVDVDALVAGTELFTPADIEFAARKGSQLALEAMVYGGDDARTRRPTTEDYQAAIAQTRPTLTPTMVREFEEDIQALARL
jgi:transitional endoplasmic reticulum ATPase